MVTVRVICVGKLKEPFYAGAVTEYAKRLGGFCRLELTELPEERLPDMPSQAQIEAALAREGGAVLSRIPKGAISVALCVEGQLLSSEALAAHMEEWMLRGCSKLVFLLGSSYGMSPEVKQAADLCLSMSPMTFPHHLARVMLLEQIYRAFQIRAGSHYHK